ncbi:MAG: hypothetical protein JEZ11_24125 [Desulfobacterales bacterium]|nr:hypothetical protein [Desulfobacterales bacterium]
MTIRKETAADIEAITDVTMAAFKTLPVSNQTEQFFIRALRKPYRCIRNITKAVKAQIFQYKNKFNSQCMDFTTN